MGQKEQGYPIIGFNVIEEVLSQHSENPQAVSNIIQQSFPLVRHTQVGALVNLIQSRSQDTGSTAVKVGKRDGKTLAPLQETTMMLAVFENLELEIQLKDNEPVQKNYISIPKPLYGEDLINRNWICKSRSAYSSPMICV